jgi:Tol biopolymer transport system component
MENRALYLLGLLLTVGTLAACGPSQAELDAQATQIAAAVVATQTAQAPTSTPAPTATPAPTSTPTPPPGEWIVFASTLGDDDGDDTSETDIYAMRVDGSETKRLTDHPGSDWDPDLSPDGRQVVFVSGRDGSIDIYVIGVDGAGLTRLTKDAADDAEPAWSPDGEHIVYACWYTANIEEGRTFKIFTLQDSEAIALFDTRSIKRLVSGIHVIGIDGADMRQLTEDEAGEDESGSWSPSWSPDGRRIVFTSDRDGDADIYIMNADGSGVAPLTDNAEGDYTPSW